ncbi:MAG: PaaI family thioesterase [bacterium]
MKRDLLPRDTCCFVCGSNNPIGLKLKFKKLGHGIVEAEFTPDMHFNGFKGIFHGGVISSVLDDAMAWAIYAGTNKWFVTTQMTISFKRSAPVGEQLTVRGHMTDKDGRTKRIHYATAQLLNSNGEVLASSEGKFFQLPDEKVKELMGETAL